jgi:hypothetical protein
VTLLLEVVGIVVLAALARAVLAPASIALTTAIAVVAVAVGGAAFWLDGYSTLRGLLRQHTSDEGETLMQANTAAGGLFPADEGFLAWANARLPQTARVYLECAGHCPGEWVTFRLAPRVFVSSPAQAQYALFYDIPPSLPTYARGQPTTVFAPQDTSGDAEFVKGQEAIVTLKP